ncbi:MAG: radical SAM protein, partial [Candidatus Margulisiibacteriota bacterium]
MARVGFKKILTKIEQDKKLSKKDIICLLKSNEEETALLYKKADELRKEYMGDDIYLRGIIEFSNFCQKNCNYCGIRKSNTVTMRYRMPTKEILETCRLIQKQGQTTVVLQSGEDLYYNREVMGNIIAEIKKETNLA